MSTSSAGSRRAATLGRARAGCGAAARRRSSRASACATALPFDDWQSLQAGTLARELGARARSPRRGARRAAATTRARSSTRRRRLALDPLNEPAHRRLIELYARERRAGRRARRSTASASAPSTASSASRRPRRRPPPTTPSGRASRAAVPEPAATGPRRRGARSSRSSAATASRRALLDAYARVGPDGRLVVLDGETGIGKTRLAEELVDVGARRGRGGDVVARASRRSPSSRSAARSSSCAARCATATAGAVVGAAAAEAARLVPELGTPPAPTLDGPGAQARFLDGVARTCSTRPAASRPAVLVVDDAHWADASSLEVLAFLARRLARPAGCSCSDLAHGGDAAGRIRRAASSPTRRATGWRAVDRRSTGSTATTSPSSPPRPARAAELAARLYEETQAACRSSSCEYLDARPDADGDRRCPPASAGCSRPGSPRASEVAGQVLAAAAVLGRPFDADLVRDVSGRSDEETVAALEELMRRGAARRDRRRRARLPARAGAAGRVRAARARHGAASCTGRAADALAARDRSGASRARSPQHLRARRPRRAEAAERVPRAPASTPATSTRTPRRSRHFREALALGHDDPAVAARGDRRSRRRSRGDYGARSTATRPRRRSPAASGSPRSSIASASSTSAAASGSSPRARSRTRSPRSARAGARGAHRWPTAASPRTGGGATTRREALAAAALALAERGRRPARARAGAQHPRRPRLRPRRPRRGARPARAEPRARDARTTTPSRAPPRSTTSRSRSRAEGELDRALELTRGGARALRRGRRPPPRGGAREQRRRPPPRARAAATRRWSSSSRRSRSSPRSARTAQPTRAGDLEARRVVAAS